MNKRYGLKVEYLVARSREVRERINSEVRTKKPIGDLARSGRHVTAGIVAGRRS